MVGGRSAGGGRPDGRGGPGGTAGAGRQDGLPEGAVRTGTGSGRAAAREFSTGREGVLTLPSTAVTLIHVIVGDA